VTLTLTLREQPPARVWAEPLAPARLAELDPTALRAVPLRCGRETVMVGELFEVSGSADGELVLAGDLRRFDGIGARLEQGRLVVKGPCGDQLAARMQGGAVEALGEVGDWAGAAMAGGLLRVRGNAGARLGGAYPGARVGMSGGEIVLIGDAGEEAGAGMRRGFVAIGGRAGAGAGLRMLAGTVVALGGLGPEAGFGNRRGSLVSGAPHDPLPGYELATRYWPPALALQLRRARALGMAVDERLLWGRWTRWAGDFAELGRGELLIFEEQAR
jgi:formylmethanofuran dehydrogenase subunit C